MEVVVLFFCFVFEFRVCGSPWQAPPKYMSICDSVCGRCGKNICEVLRACGRGRCGQNMCLKKLVLVRARGRCGKNNVCVAGLAIRHGVSVSVLVAGAVITI